MSIKNSFISNGISVALRNLIRVGEQLALVPFFISAWGPKYYGEWITLTIIPNFIALSDFGFGTAAASSLVLNYSSGNKANAATIAKSGFWAITLLLVVSFTVCSVSFFLLESSSILKAMYIPKNDALLALLLLTLAVLIKFYNQLFEGYYRAARKASLSINLISLNAVLNILFGLLVLFLKLNVVYYALSQLFVSIIFCSFYSYYAKRIVNFESDGIVSLDQIKTIAKIGFGHLLAPIWQAIYFQGTNFIVRLTLGPEFVVIFNTVRTATRSVNQLVNLVDYATFPELQFELGAGNLIKVRKIYRFSVWFSFFLALTGTTFLFFFGVKIYSIWTHSAFAISNTMWNLFLLGIIFNSLWWVGAGIFRAYNKPYQFTLAGTISAIISVIFSYFLSQHYALVGVAFGSIILDIIMFLYLVPASCKMLDMSISDLVFKGYSEFIGTAVSIFKRNN